tara:strand:+ start:654 stop:806 length:153 start_codon:yes stop_codon:yes gene_type:complete
MGLNFHFPLLFSVLPDRYWSQAEDQQTKKKPPYAKHWWFTDRFSYLTPAS